MKSWGGENFPPWNLHQSLGYSDNHSMSMVAWGFTGLHYTHHFTYFCKLMRFIQSVTCCSDQFAHCNCVTVLLTAGCWAALTVGWVGTTAELFVFPKVDNESNMNRMSYFENDKMGKLSYLIKIVGAFLWISAPQNLLHGHTCWHSSLIVDFLRWLKELL